MERVQYERDGWKREMPVHLWAAAATMAVPARAGLPSLRDGNNQGTEEGFGLVATTAVGGRQMHPGAARLVCKCHPCLVLEI